MTKRRRVDFEDGVQSANGAVYASDKTHEDMSYDDPPAPSASAAPFSENTSAPTPSADILTGPSHQERKQVSYVDPCDTAVPAGPYSYTTERRHQIYYSGKDHDDVPAGKRPRTEQHRWRPRIDERYGQMGAFPEPEMEAAEGSDVDAGEGRQAWEYLKAVRDEARGMPDIFCGTGEARDETMGAAEEGEWDEGQYDEGEMHDDTYLDDGVCWAPARATSPVKTVTAQDLYYKALCKRFEGHREMVRGLKPNTRAQQAKSTSDTVRAAPKLQNTGVLFKQRNMRHGRPSLLGFDGPTMDLVATLENADVLKIIEVLNDDIDEIIGQGSNLPPSLSAWAWVLLGRLGDAGGLQSEEIGTVRDLAKRAGWALAALKIATLRQEGTLNDTRGSDAAGHMANQKDEQGDALKETSTAGLRKMEASAGVEKIPNEGTLATLHLIITVAGEFYGQKDLLDSRLPWIE
ncbi:hypothetical protein CAC42_576 [Sphaceloma murrayae]|uniref:Uncharacterized protein n=1 Tax=Sphaceloma murrayae TaxID=2082308 RepID=A0A2K1R3X5_9PEZI|nr:hypothetical protein CAC42_576 [Sphaceloma murrayae]